MVYVTDVTPCNFYVTDRNNTDISDRYKEKHCILTSDVTCNFDFTCKPFKNRKKKNKVSRPFSKIVPP